MNLNQAGIDLIKHFESCRLKAYKDGGGIWSIGWGHTGLDVHEGLVWTQSLADQKFNEDIEWAVKSTRLAYDHAMFFPNDDQFSATVSFVFNVRNGSVILRNMLMRGGLNEFPLRCEEYCHDAMGKVEEGLRTRRCAEKQLYLSELK